MKNIGILTALIFGLFTACSEEEKLIDSGNILGTWQLTEELLDPGDGSGVFKSVASEKTIQFLTDGSYVSNGAICNMATDVTQESSGTYDIDKKIILPESCVGSSQFNISYSLENAHLVLNFPCIEACGQKYVKIGEL